MAEEKLSRKDRLILINQYRILEKLEPEGASEYLKLITILADGYELHYPELFSGVYSDTMSEDECREVIDILIFFTALQDSYKDLDDKDGIDEYRIQFHGFDGNEESSQEGYLKYLVEMDKKFEHVVKRGEYNSHSESLPLYRTMLARWQEMGKPRYPNRMTKDQIIKIIAYEREERLLSKT